MRIIFVSDIHQETEGIARLPHGDLLLMGGDFTTLGTPQDVEAVLRLLSSRPEPCYAVLGNMDAPEAVAVLGANSLEARRVSVQGVGVGGIGGGNPSPFHTPNEWREEDMAATLATAFGGGSPLDILVSHAPPMGSGADTIGSGAHVGSTAVADFLREHRVPLVLCGHIHEARGIYDMDGMKVVNPGPMGKEGHHACIDWRPNGDSTIRLS